MNGLLDKSDLFRNNLRIFAKVMKRKTLTIPSYNLFTFIILLSLAICGCNKYSEIEGVARPTITFDHADGIYEVNAGDLLTLAPEVENGENAEFVWTLDNGDVVCRDRIWTHCWEQPGEYFVLLTVTNAGWIAREEVRIDVIAPNPPAISVAIPQTGITMLAGTTYTFSPIIGNIPDGEVPEIDWIVNDTTVSHDPQLTFTPETTGIYNIIIRARNSHGVSEKTFRVTVVDHLDAGIRFMPLSAMTTDSIRYTVAGRPVALTVIGENAPANDYEWLVNGEHIDYTSDYLSFTPAKTGEYNIEVSNSGASTFIKVVCLKQTTTSVAPTGTETDKVLEWTPAPGQFIGETSSVGGMTEEINTSETACAWALQRLSQHKFVSLGSWGGYIIVGFPGGIAADGGEYDFAIMGNAIATANEPGIVWVMQDVNGNGIADDEWYELRGSEFAAPGTEHNQAVTYYKPAGAKMDIQWITPSGETGIVEYLSGTHNQPSYYPAWITAESITFYGSRLAPRNSVDPVTGFWSNLPYPYGYADNLGNNLISGGDTQSGFGQWAGFRLSDATLPDGTPVKLTHIDFIKVQTAVLTTSGSLGELSTEVCGFRVM